MAAGILRLFADYCPSQVLGPEEEIYKRMRARTMSKKAESSAAEMRAASREPVKM